MLETLLVNLGVSYLKPLKFHPSRIMCPGAGLGHHAPRGLRVQAPAPLLAPQRGVPAERAQGRQAAARPARPVRGVALHHHRGGAGQGGFTFRVYNLQSRRSVLSSSSAQEVIPAPCRCGPSPTPWRTPPCRAPAPRPGRRPSSSA